MRLSENGRTCVSVGIRENGVARERSTKIFSVVVVVESDFVDVNVQQMLRHLDDCC